MSDAAERLRAAHQALGAWELDVAEVEPVSMSENIVFRVADALGRLYVLRLHRPWYHTHQELVSEQMWTRALLDAGIDVPVVVRTRSGAGYAETRVGGERRYAGLLGWVEGRTLDAMMEGADDAFTADRFARLGEIMAAFHEQAVAWTPPPGFTRHAFDADGLMGERPFWGRFWESPHISRAEGRRLDALRRRIHRRLVAYRREDGGAYSMIHADLHAANVVVHGERLHVIDFDDAGFGWHAYDLAVALYHYADHDSFADFRSAMIGGYRRRRSLADATVARLPLFMLIRSLASIGWAAARPELGDMAAPTASLMERAEAAASRVLADSA